MAKTVTANGNAQIDTAQSVFGGASGLFDGNGDFLSSADHTDWDFVNGDFSIEFRVRFNSLGHACFYCQQSGSGASQNMIYIDYLHSTQLRFTYYTYSGGYRDTVGTCDWTPSANTWYSIAIVRSGSTLYMFIDGVSQTVTLDGFVSMVDIAGEIHIGKSQEDATPSKYLNGWLDEYRISKGIARQTTNYTPSASAFVYDSYTKLLLHMDGADGSTTFTDDDVIPATGNPHYYYERLKRNNLILRGA